MASAGSLGSLVVSLGLDAASFVDGLTKSEHQAQKAMGRISSFLGDDPFKKAALGVAAMGTAFAAAAVGAKLFIDQQSKAIANYQDLADEIGSNAVEIASLQYAADVSGVAIEEVAKASIKLTRTLAETGDEGDKAAKALKAIGISFQDFKKLDPVTQFEVLAKALGNYADGTAKTVIATTLLGKSGAAQLRFFKDLEEQGGRTVRLTAEQIEAADEYDKAQSRLNSNLQNFKQQLAVAVIPVLLDTTVAVKDLVKEITGFDGATKNLSFGKTIKEMAQDTIVAAAVMIEALVGVVKLARAIGGSFQSVAADLQLLDAIGRNVNPASRALDAVIGRETPSIAKALENRNRVAAEANQRYIDLWNYDGDRLSRVLREKFDFSNRGKRLDSKTDPRSLLYEKPKPDIDVSGLAGADKAGAKLKSGLDAQLRAIKAFADEQKDAYTFAGSYVKGYYEEGLVQLREYNETQKALRQENLAATLNAFDKEIAALEAYSKKVKAEERPEVDTKITEAKAARARAVQKASQEEILALQREKTEVSRLQDSYTEFRAKVLELSGRSSEAEALRNAKQVADARRLITQAGGDQSLGDQFSTLLRQTADLNRLKSEYTDITGRAQMAEEGLLLTARENGLTETQTLRAVGALREDSIAQLEALVEKAKELAAVLNTPEAASFAEKLALDLKKARAEMDPLAAQYKELAQDAGTTLAQGFEDAVFSGEKLSKVIQNLIRDIGKLVFNRLVTQQLAGVITDALTGSSGMTVDSGGYGIGSTRTDGGTGLPTRGGRAIGGSVNKGSLYQIHGPEVFQSGGKDYLLTGNKSGQIVAASSAGGGSMGSPAPVNIQVINNTGVQATAKVQRGPSGSGFSVILEAVKGSIKNDIETGGDVSRSFDAAYGTRRGPQLMR